MHDRSGNRERRDASDRPDIRSLAWAAGESGQRLCQHEQDRDTGSALDFHVSKAQKIEHAHCNPSRDEDPRDGSSGTSNRAVRSLGVKVEPQECTEKEHEECLVREDADRRTQPERADENTRPFRCQSRETVKCRKGHKDGQRIAACFRRVVNKKVGDREQQRRGGGGERTFAPADQPAHCDGSESGNHRHNPIHCGGRSVTDAPHPQRVEMMVVVRVQCYEDICPRASLERIVERFDLVQP
jgi:hypothetical protein